jgi:hypothetical protein
MVCPGEGIGWVANAMSFAGAAFDGYTFIVEQLNKIIMARYKNGINGPFNGKIGNVVGVTWMGMDLMRSLPEPSSKPATAAQLSQRRTLAMVSSWLKPLKDLIWIGFQHFATGKSPMNAAVSFVMKHALSTEAGVPQIDFPKAIFSRGELLISMVKEMVAQSDVVLHIKWDNVPTSALNKDDDQATFIWYNASKEKFVTFKDAGQRGDKEVLLQLPASFAGDELHGYMHYVNSKGDAVSTSIYLGKLLLLQDDTR